MQLIYALRARISRSADIYPLNQILVVLLLIISIAVYILLGAHLNGAAGADPGTSYEYLEATTSGNKQGGYLPNARSF